MHRFSAKLLFQIRTVEVSEKLIICEERIICFRSRTTKAALNHAKRYGQRERFKRKSATGHTTVQEFVGIIDLVRLMPNDEEEVWYDMYRRLEPMKRKHILVRTDDELLERGK